MTLSFISAWVMIAAGGLFAGGILFVAAERTNLWRRMPVEQYAVDFRRSLYRLDPLMPILGGISAMAAVVFALNSSGRARGFAWAAIALIAVIIVGSLAITEPMNAKFRRLPEGTVPDGAEQLRTTWRRFHLVRTLVAISAFACIAAAVA